MIKKQITIYLCEGCNTRHEIAKDAIACEEDFKRRSSFWSKNYKGPSKLNYPEDLRE